MPWNPRFAGPCPGILSYGTLVTYTVEKWYLMLWNIHFWDATHQTDESKKSANAAIRADSLTEISFERDSIRYNKSLERDSIKNARSVYADSIKFQKQFALATKSLMDQAASIKETQEEFEKTHESYLIIPHIHMEEIVPNIDIHCFYALENLSTSPVEIIKFSFNTTAAPDFKDKFPDSVVRILDSIKDQPTMRNAYITEKYPFYDTSRFTLSPGYISGMNKHNWHIYALIQIVYRDLIFDKIRRYRAIVKMIPMGEHPTFNHFVWRITPFTRWYPFQFTQPVAILSSFIPGYKYLRTVRPGAKFQQLQVFN